MRMTIAQGSGAALKIVDARPAARRAWPPLRHRARHAAFETVYSGRAFDLFFSSFCSLPATWRRPKSIEVKPASEALQLRRRLGRLIRRRPDEAASRAAHRGL